MPSKNAVSERVAAVPAVAPPVQEPLLQLALPLNVAHPSAASLFPDFTFIDLFAGIGGFRLGLERAGGQCIFTSEWNKYSQQTYRAWYGEQPDGDITQIAPIDIPDHDILAGGFPCQPFSIAGVSPR